MSWIKRLWSRFLMLVVIQPRVSDLPAHVALTEPSVEPSVEPAIVEPAAEPPPRYKVGFSNEEDGRWEFRRNILEHLDGYFVAIRTMKREDSESFELFSRVGGLIVPEKSAQYWSRDTFTVPRGKLMSFGCILTNPDIPSWKDDRVAASFIYFRKMTSPYFQASRGEIFLYTQYLLFEEKSLRLKPHAIHFAIEIFEGRTRLLRMAHQEHVPIGRKTQGGMRGRSRHDYMIRTLWAYPTAIKYIAQERKKTPEQVADDLLRSFGWAYSMCEQAQAGVRISVKKDDLTAAFSVDLLRVPYFFADREKDDRKKIFHIVRTHARVTGSMVRSHFRGKRDFIWHGYRIHISMPGTHHAGLEEFTANAEDWDAEGPVPKGMMDSRATGRFLAKYLQR